MPAIASTMQPGEYVEWLRRLIHDKSLPDSIRARTAGASFGSEIKLKRVIRCTALLMFLTCTSSLVIAQEESESHSRHEYCETLSKVMTDAYSFFEGGGTLDQFKKESEIQAGHSADADPVSMLILIAAALSANYHEHERSATDLRLDFLHPCVTTEKGMEEIVQSIWIQDKSLSTTQTESLDFDDKGILNPRDHRKLLGEGTTGLQVFKLSERRNGGVITGCGFDFSFGQYDEIYALGGLVKLSGSVNILEHPVTRLAGLLKIKGEEMKIVKLLDGSPKVDFDVFEIDSVYPTLSNTPIIDDRATMECEDPEYYCEVNFGTDRLLRALITNSLGLSYRREGGRTDVYIQLDLTGPDGSDETFVAMLSCLGEFSQKALESENAN